METENNFQYILLEVYHLNNHFKIYIWVLKLKLSIVVINKYFKNMGNFRTINA